MPIVPVESSDELPITLSEARIQCMLDADLTDEDSLVQSLIFAAVDYCEQYTRRPLVLQKKKYVGGFDSCIELLPNLLSVESVAYVGDSGEELTLSVDQYYVDTASIVGNVSSVGSWPSVKKNHRQPVEVVFSCGYGGVDAVPETIKQCIRFLVGHWFRNRDAVGSVSGELQRTVDGLLLFYKVHNV